MSVVAIHDGQKRCLSRSTKSTIIFQKDCNKVNTHQQWLLVSHFDLTTHKHWFKIIDPSTPSLCIDISGSGDPVLSMFDCGDNQLNQEFNFKQHRMTSASNLCVDDEKEGIGLLAHPCESNAHVLKISVVHLGNEGEKETRPASIPAFKPSNIPTKIDKMKELEEVMLNEDFNEDENGNKSNTGILYVVVLLVVLLYLFRSKFQGKKRPHRP